MAHDTEEEGGGLKFSPLLFHYKTPLWSTAVILVLLGPLGMQIQWDDARQLAHHQMERENGHKAATDDISEEMSEGESKYENPSGRSDSSGCPIAAEVHEESQVQTKQRRLYLVLIR